VLAGGGGLTQALLDLIGMTLVAQQQPLAGLSGVVVGGGGLAKPLLGLIGATL
jgi:hypothetical protein